MEQRFSSQEQKAQEIVLKQQDWWQQIEHKIEDSIAEYTEALWNRLQNDSGLSSLQEKLQQSAERWQDDLFDTDPQTAAEMRNQLSSYLKQQQESLHLEFENVARESKKRLSKELSQLRSDLWNENQKKISQMIQPSYQLISQKIGQNKEILEKNWQAQRQQLEQQQEKLIRDLERQIRSRLKPIIGYLEQELQHSQNLRERIKQVLGQFEAMIKMRSQKAWDKIDSLVKDQQKVWQQHTQQLQKRLSNWGKRWEQEEVLQQGLLAKSRDFVQRLEENMKQYQQQIDLPRRMFILEGRRTITHEIKRSIGELRKLGHAQEEQLKRGIHKVLHKWQELVGDFEGKQKQYSLFLLESNRHLKQQQLRLASAHTLHEQEEQRLKKLKEFLFGKIKKADEELQAQLNELRNLADHGLEQLEGLIKERLSFADEQLAVAEKDEIQRLTDLEQTCQQQLQEFSDRFETSLEERQESNKKLLDVREQDFFQKTEQQLSQQMEQWQKQLLQRVGQKESEQQKLQNDMFGRLQQDVFSQLEQHRRALKHEFEKLEEQYLQQSKSLQQQSKELKEVVTTEQQQLASNWEYQKNNISEEIKKLSSSYSEVLNIQKTKLEESLSDFEREMHNSHQKLREEKSSFEQDIFQQQKNLAVELHAEHQTTQQKIKYSYEKAEKQSKDMLQQVHDRVLLLEEGIGEIERRQQDYLGNSVLIERSEKMRRELLDGIDFLRKEGELISKVRLQADDLKVSLQHSNRFSEEIATRIQKFQKQEIDFNRIESRLQHANEMGVQWEERWKQEKDNLQRLDQLRLHFQQLEQLQHQVEDTLTALQEDARQLEEERRKASGQKEQLQQLEERLGDLRRRIVPLESNFRRLNALEQGVQRQEAALEALSVRSESLHTSLEEIDKRMEKVHETREFVSKAETRIQELGRGLKEDLQTIEQVQERAKGGEEKAPDSATRNTVIQLSRKGWKKKEIAQATRLSIGAVELILELTRR